VASQTQGDDNLDSENEDIICSRIADALISARAR
jgi:hypothetical protein